MKKLLILIFILNLNNAFAFFEKSKEEVKKEKLIKELQDKYSEKFGYFQCIHVNHNIQYCENKVDYCYKMEGHKKGGLSCFKK